MASFPESSSSSSSEEGKFLDPIPTFHSNGLSKSQQEAGEADQESESLGRNAAIITSRPGQLPGDRIHGRVSKPPVEQKAPVTESHLEGNSQHIPIVRPSSDFSFDLVNSIFPILLSPVVVLSGEAETLQVYVFGNVYKPLKRTFKVPDISAATLFSVVHDVRTFLQQCGVDHTKKVILVQDMKCPWDICAAFDNISKSYFINDYALQHVPSLQYLEQLLRQPLTNVDNNIDINSPCEVVLMSSSLPENSRMRSMSASHCSKVSSEISQKLQTESVPQKSSTKRAFLLRASSAKFIILDVPVNPESDSLVFKQSELSPAEVSKLNLKASLVVLPPYLSKEGGCKMATAFLSAGAQCVLVGPSSPANFDESHSTFLCLFVDCLLAGESSVGALRSTQLNLSSISKFSDPQFWGQYKIVGQDVSFCFSDLLRSRAVCREGIGDWNCLDALQNRMSESDKIQVVAIPSNIRSEEVWLQIFYYCSRHFDRVVWISPSYPSDKEHLHVVQQSLNENTHVLVVINLKKEFKYCNMDFLQKKNAQVVMLIDENGRFDITTFAKDIGKVYEVINYKISPEECRQRLVHILQRETGGYILSASDCCHLDFLASFSQKSIALYNILLYIFHTILSNASHSCGSVKRQSNAVLQELHSLSHWLSHWSDYGEKDTASTFKELLQLIPMSRAEQFILQCISFFERVPVPHFVVNEICSYVAQSLAEGVSCGQMIQNLEERHLIEISPYSMSGASIDIPENKLYHVPPFISEVITVEKIHILTSLRAIQTTTYVTEQALQYKKPLIDCIEIEIRKWKESAIEDDEILALQEIHNMIRR